MLSELKFSDLKFEHMLNRRCQHLLAEPTREVDEEKRDSLYKAQYRYEGEGDRKRVTKRTRREIHEGGGRREENLSNFLTENNPWRSADFTATSHRRTRGDSRKNF
jgi:hypothetical protein